MVGSLGRWVSCTRFCAPTFPLAAKLFRAELSSTLGNTHRLCILSRIAANRLRGLRLVYRSHQQDLGKKEDVNRFMCDLEHTGLTAHT